ncbi:MAG: hypothetical protein N3E49_04865 [Bacteroidia bacterium]|nr:hypothetical protein [Bacteroidia bacterium]
MQVWLTREVAFHPRGYYRLALTLAKQRKVSIWGRPLPSVHLRGPLAKEVHPVVWNNLTTPPLSPATVEVHYLTTSLSSWTPSLLSSSEPTFICNPSDLWRALLNRFVIWDVWEDYAQNFKYDPVYSPLQSQWRRLQWSLLYPLRWMPRGYILAEYDYASLFPLCKSCFLPNAFVAVENETPLLPNLAGQYTLYTGNITESWGTFAAVEEALKTPDRPFVIAGSLKSSLAETRLRLALQHHRAWLWIQSPFVPYPVIQNLQRYASLLYAPYEPLPHLRHKVPGKFYEAAALGIPIEYPVGKSKVWDAFWRRYRGASNAPELYWSHYEKVLIEWVGEVLDDA